jgi:hypothetical protein
MLNAVARIAEGLKRAIPMRRLGVPEDYPGLVAFLLSDDAAYITGQTISVSGGLTCGLRLTLKELDLPLIDGDWCVSSERPEGATNVLEPLHPKTRLESRPMCSTLQPKSPHARLGRRRTARFGPSRRQHPVASGIPFLPPLSTFLS